MSHVDALAPKLLEYCEKPPKTCLRCCFGLFPDDSLPGGWFIHCVLNTKNFDPMQGAVLGRSVNRGPCPKEVFLKRLLEVI